MALSYAEDDSPMLCFWVDNLLFKTLNSNASRTIKNLSQCLDTLECMPKFSCHNFKGMLALSQFESAVRKALKKVIQTF
jgi:hypothetical protein